MYKRQRIDLEEDIDENGRMPTAARSFFFSLAYLAMFFLLLVSSGWEIQGIIIGIIICSTLILKLETDSKNRSIAPN